MVLNLWAFEGVVIMVAIAPWCASNLAMSMMGIMWPGAIRGSKMKCASWACEAIDIYILLVDRVP